MGMEMKVDRGEFGLIYEGKISAVMRAFVLRWRGGKQL
jgi:hypothetical protein